MRPATSRLAAARRLDRPGDGAAGAVSVTPGSGSGSSQTFPFHYSDPKGLRRHLVPPRS